MESQPLSLKIDEKLLFILNNIAMEEKRDLNNLIENILYKYTEELMILYDPEFQEGLKSIEEGYLVGWEKVRDDV